MKKLAVTPDVISVVPPDLVTVKFSSGVTVDSGNELTPTQVKDVPTVEWATENGALYTLCMTDPDAPSRKNPKFREWHHWLVGNIPGNDLAAGETLTEYVGAGPPQNSGLHRYVLLVYKQPGRLTFKEQKITNRTGKNRGGFSISKFAAKYKLGNPIAGNVFQAKFDDYVPILYQQLRG